MGVHFTSIDKMCTQLVKKLKGSVVKIIVAQPIGLWIVVFALLFEKKRTKRLM